MNKRLFIIHGWGATPDIHWFQWLKREIEQNGFIAEVPAMPNTETPVLSEWLAHLHAIVGTPDEQVYFVGHSLGCITILRYLEALKPPARVGGAVLIAGFSESIPEFPELASFTEHPLEYEKAKRAAKKIIAIRSEDDPVVPMRYGDILKERLGADLVTIGNGGHFNADDGFVRFPLVLEKLLEISE